MSVIHDQLGAAPPAPAQPAAPGAGGPGGQQDIPPGGSRRPRRRALAIAAGLGLAAGAAGGTAWAVAASGPPAKLTTAQIIAKTDPAVVDVVSTLGYAHGKAAGTGVVLTPDGEVLTNNHVAEGATSIRVTDVGNGRTYRAVVVGYDRTHDIAVLQLQGASGLATATLGDSSAVKTGDKVVGIGNAGGRGGRPSAAAGTVTGLGQAVTATDAAAGTSEHLTGVIGTNAGIQPGDSGGPLVNVYGQVIGIDTAGSAGFHMQAAAGRQQAFAIPINRALAIARQIEAGRASATVHIGATAFLGVQILPAGAGGPAGLPGGGPGGVALAGVLPGSPAARAGLLAGEQITAAGGHPVTSPSGLQGVLERYHPGDKISISWAGQAGTHTATVVLANGPAG